MSRDRLSTSSLTLCKRRHQLAKRVFAAFSSWYWQLGVTGRRRRLGRHAEGSFVSAGNLVVPRQPVADRPSSMRHECGDQWTARVQQVWRSQSKTSMVVVSGPANLQVTHKDLRTLQGSGWINDEVVNLYLRLIQDHSAWLRAQGYSEVPDVAIFSSFFWTRLACTPAGYDYPGVARWTRKAPVLGKHLLLVPINHANLHWCLAAIDLRAGMLRYYDSMAGNGLSGSGERVVLPMLRRWLLDEMADKQQYMPIQRWQLCTVQKGLPRQRDGSSCGVFMCTYAERLALGQPLGSFSQRDMAAIRLGIAADICALKVDSLAEHSAPS